MNTHVPVMLVAFELVEQAENAGIPIGGVDTYGDGDYMTIRLQPADESDAPRLAHYFGLTERRAHAYGDGGIESFDGHVGIAAVHTQHSIPAEMVEVTR